MAENQNKNPGEPAAEKRPTSEKPPLNYGSTPVSYASGVTSIPKETVVSNSTRILSDALKGILPKSKR